MELAITREVVDALLCGQPTRLKDQREQTVYELATALAAGRYIPKSLYDRAVEVLGHRRITDITVLMGMYTGLLSTFTLKFYDVPADAARNEALTLDPIDLWPNRRRRRNARDRPRQQQRTVCARDTSQSRNHQR